MTGSRRSFAGGRSSGSAGLGRVFNRDFPAREHQYGGVATERSCKNLGTLDAKTNTIVLNGRKSRLGDPTQLGKLILAQALKLTQDAHRFPDRYFSTLLGRAKFFHSGSPIVVRCDRHDLKDQLVWKNTVDHSKLGPKSR